MANHNGRSVGQTAADLARTAKALANVIKAAGAGGLKGAAIAAAKEYAPELVKLAVCVLIVLIVVPMVVISALPNIFFGFDTSKSPSIRQMSSQAQSIGAEYVNLEQFENTEIDAIITGIVSEYTEAGENVEEIILDSDFSADDLLWFVAINSVASKQDLSKMRSDEIRERSAARLSYREELRGTRLYIWISKLDPEYWMTQLGFDEDAKLWARTLHETLLESGALEKYAERYGGTELSYSGDTGYHGAYERGSGCDVDIDISGFISPETKNSHDLAAYVIQAWENNWGYVWGTFGTVLTPSLFEYKLEQYPKGVGNYEDFIRDHWLNHRTADCIGLIKGYGWLDAESLTIQYGTNGMPDYGANQMHAAAISSGAEHGAIADMPEIPGLCLWKDGHAGVYIGNGYAIEAMGTKHGVVRTAISDRGWEEWYMLPYISYDLLPGEEG